MTLKPSERRYNRTQDTIIEAARAMIADQGVENLSMRSLADALDYSPSALYKYFTRKEEILGAVSTVCMQELASRLQSAIDSVTEYPEKALAAGRAYLSYASEHPQLYMAMFNSSLYAIKPELEINTPSNAAFSVMLRLFTDGIAAGAFGARAGYGAMEMALHAWVTVHGIVMLKSMGPIPSLILGYSSESILQTLLQGWATQSPKPSLSGRNDNT